MKPVTSVFVAIFLGILFSSIAVSQEAVPAECSGLKGNWVGDWGNGRRLLSLVSVDANCVAKLSYGLPKVYKDVEIKNGTLSFACGTTGGTCHFTAHGDELWGRYGGPDGVNQAVFKRAAATQ